MLAAAVLVGPEASVAVALLVAAAGVVAYFFGRLRGAYFALLLFGLVGYATMGRGFAYWGVPPLYVGELLLLTGVLVLLLRGDLRALLTMPLTWMVLVFMAVGAAATLPYLGQYGVDALRDAASWGYATFALVVSGLLVRRDFVVGALHWYVRLVPVLTLGPALALGVILLAGPRLPLVPLSDVPILNHKGGDVAVHVAGLLAFILLGLHRRFGLVRSDATGAREWWWWTLWIAAWLTTLTVRAGFITLALVGALVLVLRPTARWWRLAVLVAFLGLVASAFEVELTLGRDGRPISTESILVMVGSVVGSVEDGDFDGTRRWRLLWWRDIVDYTVFGPYFWTGKGYGINLADEDGYQVWEDGSLRSPHNAHVTFLGRSGVPGLVAWLVLNVALAASLYRAFRRRASEGEEAWARLNLWLLAYWLAFISNATFDVYLEGPPGGIWFWCLVGFSIAVLRVQPRSPRRTGEPSGSFVT